MPKSFIASKTKTTKAIRLMALVLTPYLFLVAVMFFCQRSLLYFPSHHQLPSRLEPWINKSEPIGFCRPIPNPDCVWLMMHGNAGQAADRDYVLNLVSEWDAVYVLEYPGYGRREGKPTFKTINDAASEAYRSLRSEYPDVPICVIGESLGSGPACSLANHPAPPDKIVLVTPFDSIVNVASKRFFFLPVSLLMLDRWDNVEALADYEGRVEIIGARNDQVIPIRHAKTLSEKVPGSTFITISGGHNEWSIGNKVKLRLESQ